MLEVVEIHRLVALIVVSLSFGAAAILLWLAKEHARDLLHGVRVAFRYIELRVGEAAAILLIARAVYRSPRLPFTWDVWAYTGALILVVHGGWGVAKDWRGKKGLDDRR